MQVQIMCDILDNSSDYESYTINRFAHGPFRSFAHGSQFQDGCAHDGKTGNFYIKNISKISKISNFLKFVIFEIKAPVSRIIRPNPDRILSR